MVKGKKLTEAEIQAAVVQLMELDGWRAFRTDPVSDKSRGKGFGELGMPDYLLLRYEPLSGRGSILWIEFKAPGNEPEPHQRRWINKERAEGARVWVVDDVADFCDLYLGHARNPQLFLKASTAYRSEK